MGIRYSITVKSKCLHNNKRRRYIGNKGFRLAAAKLSKQVSSFVSFSAFSFTYLLNYLFIKTG